MEEVDKQSDGDRFASDDEELGASELWRVNGSWSLQEIP